MAGGALALTSYSVMVGAPGSATTESKNTVEVAAALGRAARRSPLQSDVTSIPVGSLPIVLRGHVCGRREPVPTVSVDAPERRFWCRTPHTHPRHDDIDNGCSAAPISGDLSARICDAVLRA
jgi:hypothetical protein